jgi:hypothetical protein
LEDVSVTLREGETATVSTTVVAETKKSEGYKVHPLDQLVEGRVTVFRNEEGKAVRAYQAYVKPRHERYAPVVNLGKAYPFGSKRQGFNVEVLEEI